LRWSKEVIDLETQASPPKEGSAPARPSSGGFDPDLFSPWMLMPKIARGTPAIEVRADGVAEGRSGGAAAKAREGSHRRPRLGFHDHDGMEPRFFRILLGAVLLVKDIVSPIVFV